MRGIVTEALFERMSCYLDRPAGSFRYDTEVSSIALDSIVAVSILSDLQERFGIDLPVVLFWEHKTLGGIVEYVLGQLEKQTP
jgi:hypothetical protein